MTKMATISSDNEFAHFQDLLGTLPMLRGLIPICLCFHPQPTTTISQMEQILTAAANQLGDTFPHLTGRVLIDGAKDGHSGIPRIARYDDKVHLRFNDLRNDTSVPSSAELKGAHYPTSMLDPKLLLPPVCFDPYPVDPNLFAPVFMIQANFIRGGLLLAFVGNHQIMDATGLGYLIELFAKALRGDSFTNDDLDAVNQPRAAVIPLLGEDYQPGPELNDIIPTAVAAGFRNNEPSTPKKAAVFRMTRSDLEKLKLKASDQALVPYISTDDAVAALLWQAVARARQPRLGKNARTQLARPMSVRKLFGLKRYCGHMVDTVYTEEEDVYELPLGTAAGKLRQDLSRDDTIRYHVQALATMCSRLSDRSSLVYGANGDLNRDLLLSSWTNMQTGAHSYGDVLGALEATRCPWKSFQVPMIIVLPKDKDGGMALVLCFAEAEMDRLLIDKDLLAYGQFLD